MKIPPVEVVASWPRPNYRDPESRAPAGQIIGSILLALVTIIVAIRLYSRKRLTNGFGLDDTFICLAYVPATAFTITGIVTQELLQWGRHIWDVEPKFLSPNLLLALIHLFLFDLATSLTKLSILAMVRRLTAASGNKIEHAAVLILAALVSANCFIFIIVEIFQCWPISSAWTISETSDYCINEEAHLISANIINTITDFIVVLLPIRATMTFQLSSRQRVIVVSLFGIGLIASSVGIARTYFTWLQLTAADYDTTWQSWYVWLSSLIELHLGIICASVPATKPLFTSFVASITKFTQERTKSFKAFELRETRHDEYKSISSDNSILSLSPTMPHRDIGIHNLSLATISRNPQPGDF
ncbi:hypothetical protein O1611_g350 [Lasiodiplodia mahajangana]|uniref:Uncharacterized protein n=1 Tax=Lasiodiplodia mahajangana TaxID=1108764 RepID=A0ACC2K0R2_9PEZI|nr:hypothetical protein O1611_g350 [Lasiodiplodia mahajangana]